MAEERDEVIGLIDIYRTIADLAGVETPRHVEGRSLEPLLRGEVGWDDVSVATIGQEYSTRAPSEDHGWTAWSVSTDRWHLIRDESGAHELYDRISDPHGRVNLAHIASNSVLVAELSAYFPRWADYLYGGPGSDTYRIGGGLVFINEGANRFVSDVDALQMKVKIEDLQIHQGSWGANQSTMYIRHSGGTVAIYDQYGENSESIEEIILDDGCLEFRRYEY